jgi:hypothetical protein
MKTRLPAIPWNESQHRLRLLMVTVKAAVSPISPISHDSAKIHVVDAAFRFESPIALGQLIA